MYAETGMFFSYLQNSSPEIQQLEEYCKSHKPYDTMNNLVQTSNISDYDLGGEGDLFKAPEPILEEPVLAVDPITAAITMISNGEDVITSSQGIELANLGSLQSDQHFLDEAFYECEKDLMVQAAIESPLDIKNITIERTNQENQNNIRENKTFTDLPFPKSVSSGNLSSVEWVNASAITPCFMDFPSVDFGAAYGMRRAFSEGDIQNLGNKNMSLVQTPLDRIIGSCTSEDRREKLSRYRNKKTKRNFGRKIKYACRKALAESQPRIRGRFAKTE